MPLFAGWSLWDPCNEIGLLFASTGANTCLFPSVSTSLEGLVLWNCCAWKVRLNFLWEGMRWGSCWWDTTEGGFLVESVRA